jgi:hypothetical protein
MGILTVRLALPIRIIPETRADAPRLQIIPLLGMPENGTHPLGIPVKPPQNIFISFLSNLIPIPSHTNCQTQMLE